MKMNEISVEEAVESAKRYKYALIYEISDMYFGSTEAMKVLDLSECIEAFFFDEKSFLLEKFTRTIGQEMSY